MIPDINTTTNARPSIEQDEPPPAPPPGAATARQEAPPLSTPLPTSPTTLPAVAPTPPEGTLAATQQRIPPVERWRLGLGLGLAVLGGLCWFIFGWGYVNGNTLVGILAILPTLMCLVAGWLLRSWWGLVAAPLVYVAISAFLWAALSIGNPATGEFALYVVLPAVVMAAIGTAIGRYRARRAEQPPQHRQMAT